MLCAIWCAVLGQGGVVQAMLRRKAVVVLMAVLRLRTAGGTAVGGTDVRCSGTEVERGVADAGPEVLVLILALRSDTLVRKSSVVVQMFVLRSDALVPGCAAAADRGGVRQDQAHEDQG
eukprot:1215855-Rhodomonas_salina.3